MNRAVFQAWQIALLLRHMKSKQLLLAICLFLALGLSKLSAQTVYIAESGKKYHAKNCTLAKTGKKGITLKEAIKQGYEPCKMCKADNSKAVEEKSVKTKEKEKTKS